MLPRWAIDLQRVGYRWPGPTSKNAGNVNVGDLTRCFFFAPQNVTEVRREMGFSGKFQGKSRLVKYDSMWAR